MFIDRADTQGAVAALKPVEEAVANGLSLVISPEGTRSRTRRARSRSRRDRSGSPWRRGVPIVPIVIRNAEDLAPRNSAVMHAATIDVKVLPPIPTSDWTVKTLDRRVAGVRQQFLDTLANW